jgi:EthD domain
MAALKLFGLIPRRPDFTAQQFHDYYRHPHGTIGRNISIMRGYVQSHRIHTDHLGPSQNRFDAVAEVWLDNVKDAVGFREEPIMVKYLIEDELKFIDMDKLRFLIADEEVLTSGPSWDRGLSPGDTMWSPANRPTSVKLLHFIESNGNPEWPSCDDAAMGIELGALRHVRCRAIPTAENTSSSYLGCQELWWPTFTAFQAGVAASPATLEKFLANAGSALTLLAQAERFI